MRIKNPQAVRRLNDLERFEFLVKKLNIPDTRKTANASNARWLLRNAVILHRSNPNLAPVLEVAKRIA